MSTLTQLNTYSNSQIAFTDDRSLIITTSSTSVPTTAVTVIEDEPVDLSAFGVTFSELRSLDNATADHITLTFDFSAALNPAVVWPSKDAYVEGNTKYNNITFTNPSTGVFVADNIQLNSDYLATLANAQMVARDQSAVYSYTITASWPGNTFTQQFDVTTTARAETNLNGLALTARSLFGHLLFDPALDPRPAIIDASPASTYDLTIVDASAGSTLSIGAGTPGSSISITGDKDSVNAQLQTVYYYPVSGFYNQTDVLNYTLTVTNPAGGGSYVSETGSFTNYVPVFGEITGITPRTTFVTKPQTLFEAPYPIVNDNTNSPLLQLTIIAPSGQIKESSTSGAWASTLTLTGSKAALDTALTQIQYMPAVIYGSTLETLTYSLQFSSFVLDTGDIPVTTDINITISNLNGTGDIVSSPDNTLLFPASYNSGNLPTVTSADTNTAYQIVLTYTNATIDGFANSKTWQGNASGLQGSLRGAVLKPLAQNTTITVSYELRLEGVLMQSGTFTKELIEFFEFINLPSSYTMPTRELHDPFSNASLLDNTTAGDKIVDVTFTIATGDSSWHTVFGNSQSESITNNATGVSTFVQTLTLDPLNTSTTTAVNNVTYTLTYDSIVFVSSSVAVTVLNDIQLSNFSNTRTYALNQINKLFPTSKPSLISKDAFTYNLVLTTNDGYLRIDTDTAPYTNSITITGTDVQISAVLQSNTIELIPTGGNTSDITVSYSLEYNASAVGTGSFVAERLGGSALPEDIRQTGAFDLITLDDNHRFFYKSDLFIIGEGGDGGTVPNLQDRAGGGGGGGGLLYDQDTNLFLNRGGYLYTLGFDGGGTRGPDAVIWEGQGAGRTELLKVFGGGNGGADTQDGIDGGSGGGAGANGGLLGGAVISPVKPAGYTALSNFEIGTPGENQPGGNQPQAGDGGGNNTVPPYNTDILTPGTPVEYSLPGQALTSNVNTTLGSGGRGGLTDNTGAVVNSHTNGKPGYLYIRFYT